ncbi:zinc-binding dehydrogenase [Candidatus Bathyarchaeota archaeon]|nr:zinc-binding dehydrogenase [Candidatus Bathyarchaeota archaeon]
MRRMRAAVLYGIGDLRVEEVEVPEVGPGEVLAEVRAATTCGTDVKILRRGYVGGIVSYPMPFGHEWSGVVAEVGPGVEGFSPGDRIRAGNSAPCYACPMCAEGKYNLCLNRTWLWGAYAEYIKVPRQILLHNAQTFPSDLSFEEAAVAEPLACVLHGSDKVGINPGDSVAIIGSGPIGLLHLQVARQKGAGRIFVSDLVDERLEVAERLGADETVNPGREDLASFVREMTGGLGVDVVIEAVGLPQTWAEALRLVKRGGRVLEFGGCPPGTSIQLETELLHYGEVTLMGSFHAAPAEFERALRMIADREVDVRSLITRRMRLEEIAEAFEVLSTSKKELKIAIIP